MKNPYKDIASYSFKDSVKFRGREEDVRKISSLMKSEICSVIYAESGIGKTSFINAGVEPVMMEYGFFPIHVIIPDYIYQKDFSDFSIEAWLVDYIKTYNDNHEKYNITDKDLLWVKVPIEIENSNIKDNTIVKESLNKFKGNLWWLLHTYKLQIGGKDYKPYLVFDQFEEIFVKTAQEGYNNLLENFFSMMEQVTSNSVPDFIRRVLDELAEEGAFFRINSKAGYKITFSLRKEFLSDFDYWTNEKYSISELYHNRMMLRPLTKEQAKRVITTQPIEEGEADGKIYDETLNGLSDEIIKKIDDKDKDIIEPVLLSIICSRLYDKATNLKKKQLEKSDLSLIGISSEIGDFYKNLVQKLITEKIFQGRRDVERFENLFVSEIDGHRIRRSMRDDKDLQSFAKNHVRKIEGQSLSSSMNKTVFDNLEDVHLIRRSNVGDDTYVELIHDRIAEVIHKKQVRNKEYRRVLMWTFAWIVVLGCVLFYTLSYSLKNDNGILPFSEITNRVVSSYEVVDYDNLKDGHKMLNVKPNDFAEKLIIESDAEEINLTDWSYLNTIEVGKNYEMLDLTIKDCPQLREVYLEKNIDDLKLEIKNCPNTRVVIGPDVNQLEIIGDTSLLFTSDNHLQMIEGDIEAKKDTNRILLKRQRILIDVDKQKVVYTSIPDSIRSFYFPKPIDEKEDFVYNSRWYHNLVKDKKNTESATDTINNAEVSSWDIRNKDVESIFLTDSVRIISSFAFKDCSNLKNIRFSRNLEIIGSFAFEDLDSIEVLDFPSSLKRIGSEAFRRCDNLRSIIFNSSDTLNIGPSAFSECEKLSNIKLPDVLIMEDFQGLFNPFFNCRNINSVTVSNPERSNVDINNKVVYNKRTGDPYIIYTDSCDYNNKSYYSKYGILFKKEGTVASVIYLPSKIDINSFARSNPELIKSGDWVIQVDKNYNGVAINTNSSKELRIPLISRMNLSFYFSPDSLRKIFVPYPQPVKRNGQIFQVRDLDENIKSNITLYVPYGCKKYYMNNASFKGFKSIEEESLWRRYYNNFYYLYNTIKSFSNVLVCFIGVIILIAFLINRIFGNKINSLGLIKQIIVWFILYTIVYWFIMLVFFDFKATVIKCNLYTIPISLLIFWILRNRDVVSFFADYLFGQFVNILGLLINRWKLILMTISAIILSVLMLILYKESLNIEKMLSYGKYDRATSLMYSQMMNKDSITSNDSALIRKTLSSTESMSLLSSENELSKIKEYRFVQDENKNKLIIGESDHVFLLDFDNHKQYLYKMPSSNAYSLDDQYIFGFANDKYSYVCKKNTTIADTLTGKYLYSADGGNYVVAITDTTCNIYDLRNKARIIKKLNIEEKSRILTSRVSDYLVVQGQDAEAVKVYNFHNLNDVVEKRVEGKVSVLTDKYIATYNKKINKTYLYDKRLSLVSQIKGIYPIFLDNKDIQVVTEGNGNYYFHSVSSRTVRTDSVRCRLPYYGFRRFQDYWNWDVLDLIKSFSLRDMRLISINDKYMLFYEDSMKTTYVYARGKKLIETIKVRGEVPKLIDSNDSLFIIRSVNGDSLFVYKNAHHLFDIPDTSHDVIIEYDRLIDKSKYGIIRIIPFDESLTPYTIRDPRGLFYYYGSFYMGGYLFKKTDGKLFFKDIRSLGELIDQSVYLNDKQKRNLKQKLNNDI